MVPDGSGNIQSLAAKNINAKRQRVENIASAKDRNNLVSQTIKHAHTSAL